MCKNKETTHPKVSVIVPVYKAEAYLHRCVDSLLEQTFRDFEVILIDDGSPDRSGEICDEYARKDDRVKVIHQPNGGVSMARQKGLDNARGEYVIHADPDDWVEPDMLEELYAKAKEEDADMVICDFYSHYGKVVRYNTQRPASLAPVRVAGELFQQLHGSCCNKLSRRACYNDFGVRFPQGISYCEDTYVNVSLLIRGIKVAYLPKAFYHYDSGINPNSLVGSCSRESYLQNRRLLPLMDSLLEGQGFREEAVGEIAYSLMSRAFRGHFFSGREFGEEFRRYRKCCFQREGKAYNLYLYLSCRGAYTLMYGIYITISKIKKTIKLMIKKRYIFGGGENDSLRIGAASGRQMSIQETCASQKSNQLIPLAA